MALTSSGMRASRVSPEKKISGLIRREMTAGRFVASIGYGTWA